MNSINIKVKDDSAPKWQWKGPTDWKDYNPKDQRVLEQKAKGPGAQVFDLMTKYTVNLHSTIPVKLMIKETGTGDMFILRTGTQANKTSKFSRKIRLLGPLPGVAGEISSKTDDDKSETDTLVPEPTKKQLRRRVSAIMNKPTNKMLEFLNAQSGNVLYRMLHKKSGPADAKVWNHYRAKFSRNCPFRRLETAEVTHLIAFFSPTDLANFQNSSASFFYLGQKDQHWDKLQNWRKKSRRCTKHVSGTGKDFFRKEFKEYRLETQRKRLALAEARLSDASQGCFYPLECCSVNDVFNEDKYNTPSVFVALGLSAAALLSVVAIIGLVSWRADEDYGSWSEPLIPTYFVLAAVLSWLCACCCFSCKSDENHSDYSPTKLGYCHCFVQWTSAWCLRTLIILMMVCLMWFSINLAYEGDSAAGRPFDDGPCNGYLSSYGADSNALCIGSSECLATCSDMDTCFGVEAHKTLDRCYLTSISDCDLADEGDYDFYNKSNGTSGTYQFRYTGYTLLPGKGCTGNNVNMTSSDDQCHRKCTSADTADDNATSTASPLSSTAAVNVTTESLGNSTDHSSADNDGDWLKIFFPLHIAEAAVLGYMVYLALLACGYRVLGDANHNVLENYIFGGDGFIWLPILEDKVKVVSYITAWAWVPCLSAFSYLLPMKLDDDDAYSWDQVMAPLWVMYGAVFIFGPCVTRLFMEKRPWEKSVIIFPIMAVLHFFPLIFLLLVHIKLNAPNSMDWVEVFVPLYINVSLIACGGCILGCIIIIKN